MDESNANSEIETEADMPLELREDIGAELDDFLLLNLLGCDEDARAVVDKLLWRHLQYFPVLAEVAGYAVERDDTRLLNLLLDEVAETAISFHGDEEEDFKQLLFDVREMPNHISISSYKVDPILEYSLIKLQALSMRIVVQTRREYRKDPGEVHSILLFTLRLCIKLVQKLLLSESARFFSLACSLAEDFFEMKSFYLTLLFRSTFERLCTAIADEAPVHETADVEVQQSYAFAVKISYLRLLASWRGDRSTSIIDSDVLRHLLDETQILLLDAFKTLDDPTPRGRHVDFCKQLQHELGDIRAQSTYKSIPNRSVHLRDSVNTQRVDTFHPAISFEPSALVDSGGSRLPRVGTSDQYEKMIKAFAESDQMNRHNEESLQADRRYREKMLAEGLDNSYVGMHSSQPDLVRVDATQSDRATYGGATALDITHKEKGKKDQVSFYKPPDESSEIWTLGDSPEPSDDVFSDLLDIPLKPHSQTGSPKAKEVSEDFPSGTSQTNRKVQTPLLNPHFQHGPQRTGGYVPPHLRSSFTTSNYLGPAGIKPQRYTNTTSSNPANPRSKSVKHVPCKFFRQSICQAGTACPFSHMLDATNQRRPCKFFNQGQCKFGAKCANDHVLPSGPRVSKADLDPMMEFSRQSTTAGTTTPP